MDFPFRVSRESGTYQFLHVKAEPQHKAIHDSNLQLQVYLTLARRLSLGLNCYALLKFSPDIAELWPNYATANYGYRFLADDFNGLGIDLGFERLRDSLPLMILVALKDLMTLRSIPEDSLGEHASEVSIFLLHSGRKADLESFLQAEAAPVLSQFFQKSELFIHLSCGKDQGYYDGMMIRSLTDISQQIKGAIQLTQTAGLL